jgi:PAS domain S-box-containing protein
MRKQATNRIVNEHAEQSGFQEISPISTSLPENVWKAIFDSIPDLVAVIDRNCNVVRVNKALANRLGKTEDSLVGKHCYESIHGMLSPHEDCPHVQLLKDGKGHVAEMYEPLLDGVFLVTTTPVYNRAGAVMGSVHIARDITIRKQAEDKLQEYNQELEELNASKDKFFSVIAHDLKSPFQGLLGFTDLLLDDFDILEKEEIKKYLINVRNASYNTYSLLENLLEWSRMQSGRMQFNPVKFNLSDEIGNVLEILMSNAVRKGILLENKVESGIEVEADQYMIRSVIHNLVTNAIKFSNPRGVVVLDAEVKPLCDPHKGGHCSCDKRCIMIHVHDQGIGIHSDGLKRIFSLNDHYSIPGTANEPGTGLGLILSKEMVERHGGKMTVESSPGVGSVFSFTLPVS